MPTPPLPGGLPPRPIIVAPLVTCIEPLVNLLAEDGATHTQTQTQVAAVLCHLCDCELEEGKPNAIRALMIHAGALPLLKKLEMSRDASMHVACSAALEHISRCLTPTSRRVYVPKDERPHGRRAKLRRRQSSLLGIGAPRVILPRIGEEVPSMASY